MILTASHLEEFESRGFFVLPCCLSPGQLESLRDSCDRYVRLADEEMDREGASVRGINHRGRRYFIAKKSAEDTELQRFLFSDVMRELTHGTMSGGAYLFWEQFVVKPGGVGMEFAWHQDSGYVGHDHRPYVSFWIPLDDVNEENGTVYLLPYESAGTRDRVEHRRDESANDLRGYFGEDPGVPVIAEAGSIAVFSSTTFHRSGANRTDRTRRVYLAQYSPEIILSRDGTRPWGFDTPVPRP